MLYRVLFTTLLLSLISTAYSADPTTDIAEEYLEREKLIKELEKLYAEQQKEKAKQENIQKRVEEIIPVEDQCFEIMSVRLTGNTSLDYDDLNKIIKPYKNRCLGKGGVNQLMEKLTATYIDNGYITSRVYIPPQDLSKGILELIVVEGIVEGLAINDNDAEDRRKLWWAMPEQMGEHLTLQKIEQGIDQLNSVQSANATMKLWPGNVPGGSFITIINEPDDEFRGRLTLNNEGQDSTGRRKLTFGLEGDNLLDVNDAWGLTYIGSKDTNAISFNVGVPYRYWNFSLSHSYSEYLNILPGNTDLFGQSNTSTLSSQYLVWRTGKLKLKWNNNLTVRRSQRSILGEKLTPQKQVPIRTAINLSENRQWGFYSLEVGLTQGTKLLAASKRPSSANRYSPKAEFLKTDGRFTLVSPISRIMSYQTSLAWQYTGDVLYSSEQMHAGDKNTVRGFRNSVLSGEKGVNWRNDFNFLMPSIYQHVLSGVSPAWTRHVSFYSFIDFAMIQAQYQQHSQRAFGFGSGFRVNLVHSKYRNTSMDFGWSKGVELHRNVNDSYAIYASITTKLF